MHPKHMMAGLALVLSLSWGSTIAVAAPLAGSYPVKNKAFGQESYAFPFFSGKVFVFHHFSVEVC